MTRHTTIYNCLSSGELDLEVGQNGNFTPAGTLQPGECYRMKPESTFDSWYLKIKGPTEGPHYQERVVSNDDLVVYAEFRVIDRNGGWDLVRCGQRIDKRSDDDACPRGFTHKLHGWASCKRR